jgi:2-dehydro-3-deoxyphosphogluconate aldolase/(4S)-4-hydroxy-2-oxoglutarate aldolase
LRLVPTGGVDEANARAFLEAGAAAVAVGSSLVPATSTSGEIADRARRFKTLTSAAITREGGDDER